ncbi:MAG TPA: hypothetical protein VM600_03870 [Actinomycetota bacterium]|nr:hypothetical protein [Actinomycetota bacterium]
MASNTAGDAATIRRYYEKRMVPVCSASRARRDVLSLLEQRKSLQHAGEALLHAAIPYSGDPAVRKAIDDFRAVLEGRSQA